MYNQYNWVYMGTFHGELVCKVGYPLLLSARDIDVNRCSDINNLWGLICH